MLVQYVSYNLKQILLTQAESINLIRLLTVAKQHQESNGCVLKNLNQVDDFLESLKRDVTLVRDYVF